MSTLGNVAAILRLFAPERLEISVTEVSRMLGVPKSSASRLMKAMMQAGILARHEGSPRYKVGNLLFEVAQLYRLNSSLIEQADEVLKAICRETGHTGYVSILDGTDVLVIRMHQGSHPLRVFTPLAARPTGRSPRGRTGPSPWAPWPSGPAPGRQAARSVPWVLVAVA